MDAKTLIAQVREMQAEDWKNSDLWQASERMLEQIADHYEQCAECAEDFDAQEYPEKTLKEFEDRLGENNVWEWICSPLKDEGDEDAEEVSYYDLSRGEREQLLQGLETSDMVGDAIAAIAAEDDVSFMSLWESGKTPTASADAVLERVREYIREVVPEGEREAVYYWGEESFPL